MPWSVEVRDPSRAYVYGNFIDSDWEVFGLLDISNPTMPFYPDLASRLGPPGFNPGAPTADGFEIVGNYAYFAHWDNFRSNTFGAELQAWDLDVDPPVKAASLQMPDETWWLNYFAVRQVPAPEQIANIEENAAATAEAQPLIDAINTMIQELSGGG